MVFQFLVLIIMIVSSVEDIRKKEVPLWEIALCGLVSAAACMFGVFTGTPDPLGVLSSLLPGIAILIIGRISGEGVGYGDGFLLLAAGPALGSGAAIMGLVIALFTCGILSGVLVAIRRAGRRSRVPFVPFLTLGMGAMILEKI